MYAAFVNNVPTSNVVAKKFGSINPEGKSEPFEQVDRRGELFAFQHADRVSINFSKMGKLFLRHRFLMS